MFFSKRRLCLSIEIITAIGFPCFSTNAVSSSSEMCLIIFDACPLLNSAMLYRVFSFIGSFFFLKKDTSLPPVFTPTLYHKIITITTSFHIVIVITFISIFNVIIRVISILICIYKEFLSIKNSLIYSHKYLLSISLKKPIFSIFNLLCKRKDFTLIYRYIL